MQSQRGARTGCAPRPRDETRRAGHLPGARQSRRVDSVLQTVLMVVQAFLALLALLLDGRATLASARVCDVTEHGAKGDNSTSDTAAIRAAIEACRGGGEVFLPAPGKYLTGPLNLTSNIRLRVPSGAMLLASQVVADYPAVPSFPS